MIVVHMFHHLKKKDKDINFFLNHQLRWSKNCVLMVQRKYTVNDIGWNIVLQIDLKLDYFSFIAGQNKTTGS